MAENTLESRYDFSNMIIYFKDISQMNAFEHLSTYVEDTSEGGEQRLYMLDFWNFLRGIHRFRPNFSTYNLSVRVERFSHYIFKESLPQDPYSIYMLLKYIGADLETKKKLKSIFENNILSADSIFELYNDAFLQMFFSVDQRTDIKTAYESLSLEKYKHSLDFRDFMLGLCGKISSYISKYNIIRFRVKFTYFVTQNIVFDTRNFGHDFRMRFKFAEHISEMYYLNVFNYLAKTPYNSENVGEMIQKFIDEKTLPMDIRRLFFDWYSDTERKWTFCNYAKKLDGCSLAEFTVSHKETQMYLDASNMFLNPDIGKADLYMKFIEIYEKVCGRIVNMDSRTKMEHNLTHGEYLEFKCMIHHFRNMIPYSLEKLLILKNIGETSIQFKK